MEWRNKTLLKILDRNKILIIFSRKIGFWLKIDSPPSDTLHPSAAAPSLSRFRLKPTSLPVCPLPCLDGSTIKRWSLSLRVVRGPLTDYCDRLLRKSVKRPGWKKNERSQNKVFSLLLVQLLCSCDCQPQAEDVSAFKKGLHLSDAHWPAQPQLQQRQTAAAVLLEGEWAFSQLDHTLKSDSRSQTMRSAIEPKSPPCIELQTRSGRWCSSTEIS